MQFPVSNDEKYLYLWKSWHLHYWIIRLTKHLPETIFIKFSDIYNNLKHAGNRIYTAPAAQGLKRVKIKTRVSMTQKVILN